jgi:hypothetical protein
MAVSQTINFTELSVDPITNTSKVRIRWESTQSGESYSDNSIRADFYISINGGAETRHSHGTTLPQNATKYVTTEIITVAHRDDGSGTVSVRTWMDTGIIAGVIEKSATFELTHIPRASTITSAYAVTLGSQCKLVWTPKASSLYYKIKFALGSWSYTTEAFCPGITSAYTYTGYPIPMDVANQFPNDPSGTMTATLYTYSDSGTTQVGSESSKSFMVTLPEDETTKPSISMTLSPVTPYAKFSTLYLQGRSSVKATFSGEEGKYGASIVSYGIQVEGKNYDTSPYTSDMLRTSGSITVTSNVKDSRGFTNATPVNINVIAYDKPKILPASDERAIICERCDADGNLSNSGTYLKIKARRSYFPLTFEDEQKNFCAIRYRYRKETANTFSDWITILDKSETATDTIDSDPISEVVSSATTAYVVQVGVLDELGESDAVQFNIPTDFVTVDIPESKKGKRIGIFRYASDATDATDDDNHIDIDGYVHGGGVDNLTLGRKLTASEDASLNLDDLFVPGCYYSPDKNTTQYISGTPVNVDFGFGLEVRQMQGKDNIRQTLYYGITTWYRHWNGQEWSSWVSSLTGVSDSVIAQDFVVDTGTSGLWNYRLWNSGYAELWGVIKLDTFGDVRHIYSYAGLPFPFTEYPTVTMTISQAVAYSYTQGAIVLSEVYALGESKIKLMMIRDGGGLASSDTAKISVVIKGKYK